VLSRSLSTMTQRLRKRVEQGKAKLEVTEAIIAKIAVVKSLSALSDAQLVIEAVAEKLEIKQAIFSELEAICSKNTLFASNTSSLSITAIGRQL
ncbi:3-hydroxyacyl-CoA dehydrogenase, partial [Escherichia coli]|nr:3-hydroxyacyl-CoA dehydrogenase [Escherichia coli]